MWFSVYWDDFGVYGHNIISNFGTNTAMLISLGLTRCLQPIITEYNTSPYISNSISSSSSRADSMDFLGSLSLSLTLSLFLSLPLALTLSLILSLSLTLTFSHSHSLSLSLSLSSLSPFLHPSQSSITVGRSLKLHPVSPILLVSNTGASMYIL